VARQDTSPQGSLDSLPAEDREDARAGATASSEFRRGDTAPNKPRRRSGIWNWRLRSKLAAILLVPTLTSLVFGGLRVANSVESADQYWRIVKHVSVSEDVAGLVHALQGERAEVIRFIGAGGANPQGDRTAMDQQFTKVDASITELKATVAEYREDLNPLLIKPLEQAFYRLDNLPALRDAALSGYPAYGVTVAYSSLIGELLEVHKQTVTASSTTEAAQNTAAQAARALEALTRAKEAVSRQQALLTSALFRESFESDEADQVRSADAQYAAALDEFNNAAPPELRDAFFRTVAGAEVDVRQRIKLRALLSHERGDPINADSAERLGTTQWNEVSAATVGMLRAVEEGGLTALREQAESLANDEVQFATIEVVTVVLIFILTLALTSYVARTLLSPLRVLRRTALEVAQHKLPEAIERLEKTEGSSVPDVSVEPVNVHTTEEIGQLARAFDAVHNEAIRMAAEQALMRANVNAMFVNLSRRSQALVERQLSLIDRLEQDEQDPDQLAHLFELDHLATRMRRNSENLLVLAGTDLSRRLTRPVPISEVVGAAVSEVEQYARVDVTPGPEVALLGRAVNDVVHLVAELLDNATAFSDPQTRVTVRIARTRAKELVIEITDRGVGMSDQDLEEANERLANPPRVDVGVSRRMGLYVVARLAKRHNIKVQLRTDYVDGGITALVMLPKDLIIEQAGDNPLTGSFPSASQTGPQSALTPLGPSTGPQPALPPLGPSTGPQPALGGSAAQSAQPTRQVPALQPLGVSVQVQESGAQNDDPAAVPQDTTDAAGEPTRQIQPTDPYAQRSGAGFEDQDIHSELELADDGEQDGRCGPPPSTSSGEYGPGSLFWTDDSTKTNLSAAQPSSSQLDEPASTSWDGGASRPADSESQGTAGAQQSVDAPTERLPIYEAVLSQWFQSVADEIPEETAPPRPSDHLRSGSTDTSTGSGAGQRPTQGTARGGQQAEAPAPAQQTQHTPEPKPLPRRQQRTEQAKVQQSAGWGAGDEGWKAAQALLNPTTGGTTAAGLPKRVPKAHLVPGSATPRSSQPTKVPMFPPRSAEAVRGRMSSLQQGVRRGRHRLEDQSARSVGESSRSSQSRHDEEQE